MGEPLKADTFVFFNRSRHLVNGFHPSTSDALRPASQRPETVKSEPGRRYMVSTTRLDGPTRLGVPAVDRPPSQLQQTSESVFHLQFDATATPPDLKFVRVNTNWATWPPRDYTSSPPLPTHLTLLVVGMLQCSTGTVFRPRTSWLLFSWGHVWT